MRRTVPAFTAPLIVVACILAIAGIGLLDSRTGVDLTFGAWYVLPIAIATLAAGRWVGLVLAGASTIVALVADLATQGEVVVYAQTFIRFAVFVAIVVLANLMRDRLRSYADRLERDEQLVTELRSLEWSKSAMLRAAAHDARSPVTVILGTALSLGRSTSASPAEQREAIDAIVRNARKLDGILSDLVDVEGIGIGALQPRRAWVDLGEVSRRVVSSVREVRSHPVEVRSDGGLSYVDPARTERIVENLVRNAARHTGSAAAIWIKTRREDDGTLLVVEDAGPGVPDERKTSIFEPFERAEDQEDVDGSGLGLFIVGAFASLHGGRAWVQDRPGGGASFRVFLPDEGAPITLDEDADADADADDAPTDMPDPSVGRAS